MIKLSKKDAFTLVETMIFVLTLSFILAASVPLIARKHKHTPKVITHGSVVCYKNSSNQYVMDTYNSRYLIDRTTGGSSCTFLPSKNVPVYKVNIIPPGGGGVKYFKNNTSYRGTSHITKTRNFKTGEGYTSGDNWGKISSSKLDNQTQDDKAYTIDMSNDDLAKAFDGIKYSKCATDITKSGDSGKVCAHWPDSSSGYDDRCYLMKDESGCNEYDNCRTDTTITLAVLCPLLIAINPAAGLASCLAGDLTRGALCGIIYGGYDDSRKYPGVPVNNYELGSSKTCKGAGKGIYNEDFCVQADISRTSGNTLYYGWPSYGAKGSYESFLKDLDGKFKQTQYGKDGKTGSDLGSKSTVWAAHHDKKAGQGTPNTPSIIKDMWEGEEYQNSSKKGANSCTVSEHGACSAPTTSGNSVAPKFQAGKQYGYFGVKEDRIPEITQTVKIDRNYALVGSKGAVAAPKTFETFEMKGTCTMQIHDILTPQDRLYTFANEVARDGIGARLVCTESGRTLIDKSVDLPHMLGGTAQYEKKYRGEWGNKEEMTNIFNESHPYASDTEYKSTGEVDDQRAREGAIDQATEANNVWAKKDKGKYNKETPFNEFGKAGSGQIVTETCHPKVESSWKGTPDSNYGKSGSRRLHGVKKTCDQDNSANWTITKEAQAGGSGAIIISW